MVLTTHVGQHVLSLVLERVPVQLGGEEELGLAPGPGTVVRRRFGRMVDGHVRLESGGCGEYGRAQVARERLAAGERVLDQVCLEAVGRGQHTRAQAALDAVHGTVERGQMGAQVDRGFLLRFEPDLCETHSTMMSIRVRYCEHVATVQRRATYFTIIY